MRENSNMEYLIQDKMEQWGLEPDPADWQAIYDRLHPKKRRRFFWWIFPLAGVLLIGGASYFITKDNNTKTPISQVARVANATEPVKTELPQLTNRSSEKEIGSDASISSYTEKESINNNRSSKNSNSKKPVNRLSNSSQSSNQQTSSQPETTITFGETTHMLAEVNYEKYRSMPGVEKTIPLSQPSKQKIKTESPATEAKKIPNTSTHKEKGWYFGVYGGIGTHDAVNPISTAKANDASPFPNTGSSGSGSYSQGSSYKNTGLHYDAGFLLQKKNKNFDLEFGLGLQQNNWSENNTLYKDSIAPSGSFYSRTAIATKSSTYKAFAIEIPLVAGFRLAGKNNSSLWFNLGLNNAVILSLKEQNYITGGFSGLLDSNSSLTSKTNRYQPQLRFGLTYEQTAKKYHWQASPYVQYGLRDVMQQGDPDAHILNLGLQFRYFFKKLR